MESKTNIYHLWIQYTTQNDEKFFWQFVQGFVDIWESQARLDWTAVPLWSEVRADSVPALAKLPDELLAAMGKFLYISKDRVQYKTEICSRDLEEVNLLLRCLLIICRNFDNIPFIASCDYVSLSAPITSKYIEKLLDESEKTTEEVDGIQSIIVSFCHLLEGLYDPYLTWRNYLSNHIADFSKLIFKPALLHVEVVPFIYDCFQCNLIEKYPSLSAELLNVLGATISGAQSLLTTNSSISLVEARLDTSGKGHNALRSVCPATVSLIIKIISTVGIDRDVRQVALNCVTVMVQVLHKSTPEQRQIELSLILEMYTDSIKKIISIIPSSNNKSNKLGENSRSKTPLRRASHISSKESEEVGDSIEAGGLSETKGEISYMLVSALVTLRKLLEDFESSRSAICQLLIDLNYLSVLISLPDNVTALKLDDQSLGIECIKSITRLLSYSRTAKKAIKLKYKYDDIAASWLVLGTPSRELLLECLHMAMDGKKEQDEEARLFNPEVVLMLINSLNLMTDGDQLWIAQKLSWLCTKDLRSKWLACQHGAILAICNILSNHSDTVSSPTVSLINLMDNLACTSITSQELKQIMLLLRKEKDFSHKIPLLHILCNITRKGYFVCKAFLDLQSEADGITVPNICKWNNTSYGFSFHCWICIEKLPESHESFGKQRQLLNLLTQSGQGIEISIDQAGGLVVTVLKKNSVMSSTVPSAMLDDGRWHCITVCMAYARRALSHNQVSVYIDGTQRLAVSMKFPSFDDVFMHCCIGAPVPQDTRQTSKKPEVEKESFHGTLVKNLFNNQFLPSLVLQAPSYLSFGSMGSPKSQVNTMDPSHGVHNQVPLHGHIAHASLFNDTFTPSAARWLHEAGADCHTALCSEEGSDSQEMFNRLVFCFSALATWDGCCMNLGASSNYNGSTMALRVNTTNVKEVINAISNVHVFFPLLEDVGVVADEEPDLDVFRALPSPLAEQAGQQLQDWEVLPSNSYTEWKLDHNPVSMFLTLLKNSITGSHLNQEELVKNEGVVSIGMLLCQCKPSLIDVNVLMATQLLVETVRDIPNPILLKELYQNILFNFKIWSRSAFHIRIGHIQYISNLIKHDRLYFRKNFGVQYFFDVIRTFYANGDNINMKDAKTIRLAFLGIIKYFISKDININELLCALGFLESVKEEQLLIELLEMLMSQMEAKNCKDQIFLLLHEKFTGETLYVLLLNRSFGIEFKFVLVKFLLTVIRTDRVHSRNKSAMQLQDGHVAMFPGLIGYMEAKAFTLPLATSIFDLMCYGETKGGYAGILALLHCLTFESIDIKLELAKKLLAATFINLNAPFIIAKLVGWQDCIARLLIKRCISETIVVEEAIDLMTFDEESLKLEPDSGSFSHHSHIPSLSEAANVIEHEIKEIAGSVHGAVAGNLQYAADNLTTAVASVCSVIRQKTVDIQESLGELGHLSRPHLPTFHENDSVEFNADSDSILISNRSVSVSISSIDDENNMRSLDEFSGHKTSAERDAAKQLSETLIPGDLDLGDKYVDKEENLSYIVANILFTILWRGVEGSSKESWKERGQVMACINLLALNNELYCSHLQLRLRLLEMGVQASLLDLKETGSTALGVKSNALYLMRLVYDLVVLDPNKDDNKKCSSKLLDGVLALLDSLKVFGEEDQDPIRRELARLGLGVVVSCAGSTATAGATATSAEVAVRASMAAPACALLHSLLRSPGGMGSSGDTEAETAYLMCSIGAAMKQSIEVGNLDQYSFLLPVMKALLEKVRGSMNLHKYLPELPRTSVGPAFFSDFQGYVQGEQWAHFIEYKVRPLSIAYDRETNSLVGEPLNTFWAECYEACKAGANARAREQTQAKGHFQSQVISSFKNWRTEDLQRYNAFQNQVRGREARAAAHWKARRAFLTGPRGAWDAGTSPDRFWRLSPHENLSRMRLRLEPAPRPASHAAAARLRDNLGRAPPAARPAAPAPPARPVGPLGAEDELEDEFRMPLEPEIQPVESGKEKMVVSQECELVTLMTKVKGRLDVTTSCLYFHDLSPVKEDVEREDFTLQLSQLREIHLRRYNLRRSALEIFLIDQTNYFLNFTTKTRNGVFTRILSLQPPNILYGSGQSPSELLKASGLTQKWVNREITNFDYLMHLNTIAGRTYNDLSQYPVYPWILADYHSERLDLENPESFRNLSNPIGVVNPKNEAEVKAKYDNFEDPTGVISKFHYGTHYSNSAGVLHYLLRVEPFTSLHVELQSGRFDVADRQFHSIAQTWKLLMNNPNDVKELTPEFFYFPEFLQNINNLDLGILQGTNHRVADVALPPWAEGSADNFIYLHRKALESDYVSENLNNWIDLVFGYKQRGPRAVEALNVFYYCSYEGAVDLDAIVDPAERAAVEGMIANFGQTPAQLVRGTAHPVRLTAKRVVGRALRGEARALDCLQVLGQLTTTFIQVSRPEDPIVWLGGPIRARGFLQGGGRWVAALTRGGALMAPSWQPNNPAGAPLDVEHSTNTMKTRRQINIIGKKCSGIDNRAIAMSSDGKLLYTGGHWDCSIKVFSIASKVKLVSTVIRHFGPVQCLALDTCSERWLVSGAADSSLAVWEVGGAGGQGATPVPVHSLCGHDAAVTCVAVMAELDVVVSGSEDGTVNVYSLKKGEFIHTLQPKGCNGVDICVKFIVLSHQGHIGFIVDDKIYNSVHVFTLNGAWRSSRNVCGRVTALNTIGDCLLIADDGGDITISTTHSLKPVYDVPLHVPIEHVLITPHNTHLLVALADGKVAIIGLPPAKKNSMHPIDVV